ncbi:MAG TPA: hypothetical protein VH575_30360 [Gemmataceae bacterium]|jgi:hypothetical protein
MMFSLRLIPIFLLLLTAAAPARGQDKENGPVRIALVSAEKGETLVKVLTVAEAKLTELPGVEMLERSAIDRVLAEHKLTLSGLVAADQAVAIGKLLTVDLFAVLDAGSDAKEVGGLVIFDAHTGVRLWDAALPAGKFDATVRGVVDAVAAARQKHQKVKQLRPVCVLTVRNVDLPRDMDAFCDSVRLLLERRLVASPDLAVLERRRLNQVNRERDLPTASPLRQLLVSVVTLELEVGRSSEKDGLRATALLSDGRGKSLGKATVEIGKRDAAALSAALLRETARVLEAKVAPAEPERKRESARFLREAEFYLAHKDPVRALPAAQSAYALSPDDPSLRVAAARILLDAASDVIDPGGKLHVGSFVRKVDPDTLERSLELARDGSERLLEVESLPENTRLTSSGNIHKMFAEGALFDFLKRVDGLTEGVSADARAVIEAVHANQRRLNAIRMRRIEAGVHDRASFEKYTEQLNRSFFWILNPRRSGEEWVETQEQLRPWAALARKYADAQSSNSRSLFSFVLSQYRYPPQISEEQATRLRKLWSEISEHPDPIVTVYGRLGFLATELSFHKLSDEQRRTKVHEYRLFVQEQLEKAPRAPDAFRLTLYLAAFDAIDQLRNRPGLHEELKELTEFMFGRKELVSSVAQIAAFHFSSLRTPEGHRYAYGVLRRALSILDGKEGHFLSYSTSPQMLRHEQEVMRREYRSRQDQIAQADPSAAPDRFTSLPGAQTLIDVYPNKEGIVWLHQPVVDKGTIYVAGIELREKPLRHAVRLVRLTLDKEGKWEGRKIEVSLRNQPWAGSKDNQFRLGIYFGTSACVHDGHYYLGTRGHGIFAFPFDDGAPERITTAEGLPSNFVQGLACFEGKLYAYLGEPEHLDGKDSYIVAWDLRERKCEVLASSRRKEKRSPFDDNNPLLSTFFRTDAKRKQILFAAHAQHPLNGLWAFDVQTKTFKRLFILHNADVELVGPSARIEGNVLRMPTKMGVFDYDLARNDGHLRYDNGEVRLEVGPTRSAVFGLKRNLFYRQWTNNTWNAAAPFALTDGWLWAAKPFSRRSLDGGEPELLAPLRPGQKFFQPGQCLQKFDDRRLLVGDEFGLWLVSLPEKKKERDR